jgi:hypothetical protein
MLAVVDARENKAWTHSLHILIENSEVQEIERRDELLEEPMADTAAPYGTQRGVGRKWNLGQPFHGFFDFREVWRRFLERDAFHDQVHGPLVDKVVYDFW